MKNATSAQINAINILAAKAGFKSAREAIAHFGHGDVTPGQLKKNQVKELTLELEKMVPQAQS